MILLLIYYFFFIGIGFDHAVIDERLLVRRMRVRLFTKETHLDGEAKQQERRDRPPPRPSVPVVPVASPRAAARREQFE